MQQKATVFAQSESIAEAAVCLYGCSANRGELTPFYEELIKNGGVFVLEKLQLLKKPVFGNNLLTNDK